MAKLTLLLAAFAVLLLVANASIYRTTIEIDEEDPRRQDPRGQQDCRQQIQRQQQLNHCQRFLQQECQQRERSRGRRDNPQQHFDECCQQLRQLDTQCRCEGLKQAVQRQQQQEQLQGEEVQDMYETAKNLPRRCGIPPQECRFSSNWWF